MKKVCVLTISILCILISSGNVFASERHTEELAVKEVNSPVELDKAIDVDSEEISSIYDTKTIMLFLDERQVESFGAKKAIYYDGMYVFNYDTEYDTKKAYESLTRKYGDKVLLDLPIKSESLDWGKEYINAATVSESTKSGENIKIAVIDSGINEKHEIFNGRVIEEGYDFVQGDKVPQDISGHGTAVAGIIAGSTQQNASIIPIRVLDEEGSGDTLNLIKGIKFADSVGANVINMSLAIDYLDDIGDKKQLSGVKHQIEMLDTVLKKSKGILICAAGNDNADIDEHYTYPAASPYTITVGAIDEKEGLSRFSNYGKSVDFVAPGSNIRIADAKSNTEYKYSQGTSFASPYITAMAANICAVYPYMNREDVVDYLADLSNDLGEEGKDAYYGYGAPKFANDNFPVIHKKPTIQILQKNYVFDGKGKKPNVNILINDKVVSPAHYTLQYAEGRINKGNYAISVKLQGKYSGENEDEFTISAKDVKPKIKISKQKYVYSGKRIEPNIKVLVDGKEISKEEYSARYPKNIQNVGEYIYNVSLEGNYVGSADAKVTVIPKKKNIKTIKWQKKALEIRWRKGVKQVSGYHIQVATNKKFTKSKKNIYVKGSKKTKKTIKKLKAKKKYYIKMRAYKVSNGKRYYSNWSKVKKIKTK